jgi:hypothetical protein
MTQPRTGSYFGMPITNQTFGGGTWIEGEEFCYPKGGMTRFALACCPDGVNRCFRAGIADTFFSVPASGAIKGKRVKGFLSLVDNVLTFTPTTEKTDA